MSPQWSPDGKLLFINDKSNWWNLYRLEDNGTETNLYPCDKELGGPQWVFGTNAFACIPGNQDILVTYDEVIKNIELLTAVVNYSKFKITCTNEMSSLVILCLFIDV